LFPETHWERTLGLFRSVVAFWRFLFDRGYRQRSWAAFRAADTMDRALMILYALVSVIAGLVALAIVLWIVATL
jgi:hypothetical protein